MSRVILFSSTDPTLKSNTSKFDSMTREKYYSFILKKILNEFFTALYRVSTFQGLWNTIIVGGIITQMKTDNEFKYFYERGTIIQVYACCIEECKLRYCTNVN